MPHLQILINMENSAPELAGKLVAGEIQTIGALPSGMRSGNPSIGIVVKVLDKDGEEHFIFGETSLKLFLSAADIFKAEYGDPREDAVNTGAKPV